MSVRPLRCELIGRLFVDASLVPRSMSEKRKDPTWLDRFLCSAKRVGSPSSLSDDTDGSPSVGDAVGSTTSNELSTDSREPATDATQPQPNVVASIEHETNSSLPVYDSRPETHDADIGYQLSLKSRIGNEIKYRLLTNRFQPDKKYRFPARQEKDAQRRFVSTWLDTYSFLSYSPYYEGAFCSACVLFASPTGGQPLGVFVQYPCSQYRHLKHFSTLVKAHQDSQWHKDSLARSTNFIRTYENPATAISHQLDRQRLETINRNKSILSSVVKVIVTCARQNIPLRGHRGKPVVRHWKMKRRSFTGITLDESVESIRDRLDNVNEAAGSNFIALLKQRVDAGDDTLRDHLQSGPRNASYTSARIQNEVIEIIHEHVLSSVLARVDSSTLFSVIVDGTTDTSTVEQLSFLIRFVDNKTKDIREDFLTFIPTASCTGAAIADHILSCLQRFGLLPANCIGELRIDLSCSLRKWPTFSSRLVGQAYDGAPNMAGAYNGCQAIVRQVCVEADYMHCSSHSLNLALVDSCSVTSIRNMMGTIKSIIEYFNDSAKRTDALKQEISRPDNEYIQLSRKRRLVSLVSSGSPRRLVLTTLPQK